MARLFGRIASLIISREGDSKEVTGQRMKFKVEKFAGNSGTRATITIFNLPVELRSRLARRRVHLGESFAPTDSVFLRAGYQDRQGIISSGAILEATNTKNGVDWITEITTYTSLEQQKNAILMKSYASMTAFNLINNIFEDSGLPKPVFSDEAINALNGKSVKDFTVQGSLVTQAIEFLDRYNLSMTIDERGFLIAPRGTAHDASTPDSKIPIVTDQTGLIGAPKVTPIGVNVKMLLDPRIKPLESFIVGSATISALPDRPENQRYTARQVVHVGDTRGDDWFTEVEAVYPNMNPSSAEFELRSVTPAVIL